MILLVHSSNLVNSHSVFLATITVQNTLRISSVNVKNLQFPTVLVTFTEEIFNEKLHF